MGRHSSADPARNAEAFVPNGGKGATCTIIQACKQESLFLIDNRWLNAAEPGLAYRLSKQLQHKDPHGIPAEWGTTVWGIDHGDSWLQVGDRYLPMVMNGTPVVTRVGLEVDSPLNLPAKPVYTDRYCTDLACLALLVVFLGGMVLIYKGARSQGDIAKLTHGFNWQGEICGVDDAVKDRPVLFWCDAQPEDDGPDISLLDGVCMPTCPEDSSSSTWCPERPQPFEYELPGADGMRQVVIGMARNLTQHPNYPTTEALGYCFPNQNLDLLHRIIAQTHVSSLAKQLWLAGHGAIESWRFLLGVTGACVFIGYAFLFILWFCFDKILYGMLALVHILLLLATAALGYGAFDEHHNFFSNYTDLAHAKMTSLGLSGVILLLWILFTVLCCYSKGAVGVTIDSVKATCEVIGHLPSMLLQPLVHSAVVLSTLLVLLYGFAWVLSVGKVVPHGEHVMKGGFEISGLQRSIEFTPEQWAQVVYWLFGTVWIFETVNALGQFAISHAVVMYACFAQQELMPMWQGYCIGLTYHLGTFAFGGFIIGCLKVLAAIFSYLAKQAGEEEGLRSYLASILCCCCAYCSACMEQVVSMVNDLVYTDVALRGSHYIKAASNAVQVAASNPATYATIKGSATAIRVCGVTTIGCTGTFLSYQVLASSAFHRNLDSIFDGASSMLSTSSIIGTTIASGLICFYVATAFMMVFYQSAYTLMYCMLIGAVRPSWCAEDSDEEKCSSSSHTLTGS